MNKPIQDYLFVSVQLLLLGLYLFELLPVMKIPDFISYVGLFIAIVGFAIALLSVVQLSSSLTVFPSPKSGSEFITKGLYKYSRHPIYTGVILFTFAFAVFRESYFKLIISAVLLFWLYLKSSYEEKKLEEKFSDYKTYQQNTGRFFPKWKTLFQ
jgi:protein-S-isoprenylcysteine O-methyltransferase Ste14